MTIDLSGLSASQRQALQQGARAVVWNGKAIGTAMTERGAALFLVTYRKEQFPSIRKALPHIVECADRFEVT